jgi:hypothetical protein
VANTLKSQLTFTNVAPGATATLPHTIKLNGTDIEPDHLAFENQDFDYVSSTVTTLTVINNGVAVATGRVLCELWHTIERVFGDGTQNLPNKPFIDRGVNLASGAGPSRYVPNEMWAQADVAALQADVQLETNVSQLFATWRAPRAGSIVGLVTRFSEAITAGSVTLTVRVNGVAGVLVATSAAGTGTQVTQASGIDVYAAGDLLDIAITTNGTFAPTTADVEAYLQVQEGA